MTEPATFDTLEKIFQMMMPVDYLGVQRIVLGSDTSQSPIVKLSEILYGGNAGSGMKFDELIEKFKEITNGADEAKLKQFSKIISAIGSQGVFTSVGSTNLTWPYSCRDSQGAETFITNINDVLGGITDDVVNNLSTFCVSTPFVSPQTRDASKAEIFLNSLPSVVISRSVPYVELEFAFNRGFTDDRLAAPGLLKFLIGPESRGSMSEPDRVMHDSRRTETTQENSTSTPTTIETTLMGMEAFTSPQTLVNATNPSSNRYVDVLDPFRPFMSLINVSINVAPTAGIYSFKKATAVIKLHDKSRLADISGLIRPQVYTQTTVWLTYGWRHPFEPDNPYAMWLNKNMIKREAYGVKNVQYSFDQAGQVDVTLELYTKNAFELRTLRLDEDSGFPRMQRDLNEIMETITRTRRDLNLVPASGASAEIRGFQVLDAAERGSFPDFSVVETQRIVKQMVEDLRRSRGTSAEQIDALANALNTLYEPGSSNPRGERQFAYRDNIRATANNTVRKKFNELTKGMDPWLVTSKKIELRSQETDATEQSHPFLDLISSYNREQTRPDSDLRSANNPVVRKQIVSFGKLFTVFMGSAVQSLSNITETQIFFYQLNSQAGKAAAVNIAEFLIDVPMLMYAYRDEIERRGSSKLTIEEFMRLVVDTQFKDHRNPSYGFRTFYQPFDPNNRDPALIKGQEARYESALAGASDRNGPFVVPQIEIYIETIDGTVTSDPLEAWSSPPARQENGREVTMGSAPESLLRIHIFDKTNSPYESAQLILRGDTVNNSYYSINQDYVKSLISRSGITQSPNPDVIEQILEEVQSNNRSSNFRLLSDGTFTNARIKEIVSKTVPTIIYGANGSAVISAQLATNQDPVLTAAQLTGLNKNKIDPTQPDGSSNGGLPLRIIPAKLSLTTLGCPLINYAQYFFVDFNTGTTVDNIYGVTGLTHSLSPGKFESNISFAFYDAYGTYEGAPVFADVVRRFATSIQEQNQNVRH